MTRALLGLIGTRIDRSISPAMHEAAGRALGIDLRYHLIDAQVIGFGADALPQLLKGVELAGFTGVNVTFPFKESILRWLDRLGGASATVGAVNTVVVRDRRRIGYNTDYTGFIAGWRRALGNRRPESAALIGAGAQDAPLPTRSRPSAPTSCGLPISIPAARSRWPTPCGRTIRPSA